MTSIVNEIEYKYFTVNNEDYRTSKDIKGLIQNFLIEQKDKTKSDTWINVGVVDSELSIEKYKHFLQPNIPGLPEDLRLKLLAAIISTSSVKDMIKNNRKRSNSLLDGLIKRI